MSTSEQVLERKVIHAGDVFIKEGQEHARAYLIQTGLIRAFIMENDKKVIVAEYEPGRIIGETCLMVDEPMNMNFEAVEDSVVVTITRQDFQNKIRRINKDIMKILEHVMNKLNYQEMTAIDDAKRKNKVDPDALKMVAALTTGLPEEKKFQYEQAILPHVNAMIKEIKRLKGSE